MTPRPFHTHCGIWARGAARVAALTLVLLPAFASAAQAAGEEAPQGEALFQLHCAACHGLDATGSGPMARTLRHEPPDLTRLSRWNGGTFPAARVRRIIEGRDVASHGDRDMPVWGDAFRSRRGATRNDDDATRIAEILRYLESIQNKDAQ